MTDTATPSPEPAPVAGGPFGFLPSDPRTRNFTIAGIVVALLLLLFVASRLLLGGGGEDQTATPTTIPGTPAPRPTTTTVVGTPESFEVFSTKNPFTPLINPPGTGGGPAPVFTPGVTTATTRAPGTTGGPGTTGTTSRPGTGTGTSGGTTGTTTRTAQGGTATEPRQSQRVALLDVFTQRGRVMASVRVNDTVYRVGEGETFAGNYKVVSLSASTECGRFLFGDSQFRLCRGEETLK